VTPEAQPSLGRAVVLAALMLCAGVANAREPGDRYLGLGHTRLHSSDFRGTTLGDALNGKEYRAWAGFGGWRAGAWRLGLGLDYEYTRYEYDGVAGRDRDLHRLQLPLRFARERGAWQLAGHVAPGVSTSSNVMQDLFSEGSGEDLLLTARLEASRARGSGSAWLLGAAYDRAFGSPAIYPVLGVAYAPAPGQRLRLAFPETAWQYAASSRLTWFIEVYPAGHEWHVEREELDDDFDYTVEAWRGAAGVSLRVSRATWLDLTLGYQFAGEHEFTDDLGRRLRVELDSSLAFGFALRLGAAPRARAHAVPEWLVTGDPVSPD